MERFKYIHSPIITGSDCEGAGELFTVTAFDLDNIPKAEGKTDFIKDFFGKEANLTVSGQLSAEMFALALGDVYTFGPTFRAEKSKTRRHLTEFWMVEPEVAFATLEDTIELGEDLVVYIIDRILEKNQNELEVLERDTQPLEKIKKPFPRITYDEAVKKVIEKGSKMKWGDDFGAPEETLLSEIFDKPVSITHFPLNTKAFYMQPDPERPDLALCIDMIASEGYGEIIGGGQRIHDYDLLMKKIKEHKLPEEAYKWYLDLRQYGSVPHSGFGLGIERTVAWLCKLKHIRETIPFPRLLYRIYP